MNSNSTDHSLIIDVLFTFVVPPICLVSLLTNLVNVYVFTKMRHFNVIYKFLLCKSVSNTLYLCICMFIFVAKCGRFCSMDTTYLAKVYELYLFLYGSSVLGLSDLLIEIVILLQRIFILINKPFLENKSIYAVIVPLFTFAAIYYVPFFFIVTIEKLPSSESLEIYKIQPVPGKLYETTVYVLNGILRCSLMFMLIILLNVVVFLVFKHRLVQKKRHLIENRVALLARKIAINKDPNHLRSVENFKSHRRSSQSSMAFNNFNRMVIIQSVLYLLGNLPFVMAMIVTLMSGDRNSPFVKPFYIIINICLFTSLGLNIILYTSCNREFKRILVQLGSSLWRGLYLLLVFFSLIF